METAVAFRAKLDGELSASLVASLLQFLLFMRGQLPSAFDALQRRVVEWRESQAEGTSRRPPAGAMGKAVKCVEAVQRLCLESLPAAFSDRVATVVLVFGASIASPREAVVVDLTGIKRADLNDGIDSSNGLESPAMSKAKIARLCSQKLLRALIADGAHEHTSGLVVTRVHVALLAAKNRAQRIPGFLPKQTFRLKLPKAKKQHSADPTQFIRISSTSGTDAHADAMLFAEGPTPLTLESNEELMCETLSRSKPSKSERCPKILQGQVLELAVSMQSIRFDTGALEVSKMLQSSSSTGSFASIEERVAHLNWRKMCNERQIQETLRRSKQMQERDEFLRVANKHDSRGQREWMHNVIASELQRPLPVTEHAYHEMAQQQVADERRVEESNKRHMSQIRSIQAKLDAREAELERKRVFERKKKELFSSNSGH